MAAPTGPEQALELGQSGCYVYGIVPADVESAGDVRGVGDPPGRIQLVRHGNLAALVSEVDLTRRLGTPEDLQAHAQILDTAVVEVPVLPLRFGSVMTTKNAVAQDLLAVYQEAYAAALKEIEGRAQYVVKGEYVEQAVLAEALAEIPEAARLGKQIRGRDPDATWHARIRLGQIISKAIIAKRKADTRLWVKSWPRTAWPAWSGSQPTNWTPFTWRCWSRSPARTIWNRPCRTWPRTGKDGLRYDCSARWPRTTSSQPWCPR